MAAGRIIAEVNRRMPRTLGDSFIHVSKIDAFVEVDGNRIWTLYERDRTVALPGQASQR